MKLRDYQQIAVDSVFNYFSHSQGNPVIAMPTGVGKSLVVAGLIEQTLKKWPNQRFMMLTHVKELVEQNGNKLRELWPQAPLGIYSAGLNSRDTQHAVIFGGVQSVAKKVKSFGWRDIIIVDECHTISPKETTTYRKVITALTAINPNLKVIGLSATPYRLGQGMITDGGIFTDICCNMTGVADFNRFIELGYLAPLIPFRTSLQLDLSGVRRTANDFNLADLQAAVDKHDVNYAAVQEIQLAMQQRKCGLIFASGIDHAEHLTEMLNACGVPTTCVHSKMNSEARDNRLASFKGGYYQCMVNNGVLTTGFDHPPIDFIGMLRATTSPGLWVQMLGRGTRPCEGKINCAVADFSGNTPRLGPINDPVIPRKKGKAGGDAPVKLCEVCGAYNHASARICCNPVCLHEFIFVTKVEKVSGDKELIRKTVDEPDVQLMRVDQVFYQLHKKKDKPNSMRVRYVVGMNMYDEYIFLEHTSFARNKAHQWWRQRHIGEPPQTAAEAIELSHEIQKPARIKVWVNKKHPEVIGYEW